MTPDMTILYMKLNTAKQCLQTNSSFIFLFYPIWDKISFPATGSKLSVFQRLIILPTRDNVNYILID